MFKKIILVLVGIFFFFGSNIASANVSINEIMYNSEGADVDWVEIYNSGTTDVDITTLFLLISNSTSNHSINNYSGSQTLHPNEYGAIVVTSQIDAFTSKWGSSGNIFTSSFSLPNVVDENLAKVEINNGDKTSPISSVSYKASYGANGDGNSLQLVNGTWKGAIPTPTTENQTASGGSSNQGVDGNNSNTTIVNPPTSNVEVKTKTIEPPTIKTKIISKNLAFVGIPFIFQANTLGYSGEMLRYGKYYWNFGDGDFKEQINNFDKFSHTYLYGGEYTVSVEYYMNSYGEVPDTLSKINVDVVPLAIAISRVGDEKDFFIELTNNSDYEIDISRWMLSSLSKNFILPRNTNIASNSKMILSSKITNFTIEDEKNLKLLTPTGNVVYSYDTILPNEQVVSLNNIKDAVVYKPKLESIRLVDIKKEIPVSAEEDSVDIVESDLEASALESAAGHESNSYLFFIGFIILLVVSSISVYLIRRKKVVSKDGDDFEIIDE